MDCKRIELLLEKFWDCQTTLEEEEELRRFFNQEAPLPESLREYRTLFVYQEKERNIRLSENFEKKILGKIQDKGLFQKRWMKWAQVAAMALLLLGSFHLWREQGKVEAECALTPEEALAEVRQALDFVSLKLNRSQQLVEQNLEEIEVINRYIKK